MFCMQRFNLIITVFLPVGVILIFIYRVTVPSLQVEWVLNGTWDSKMEGSKVIGEAFVKGKSSLGMASYFRFCFPTRGSGSGHSFLAADIIRCVYSKIF